MVEVVAVEVVVGIGGSSGGTSRRSGTNSSSGGTRCKKKKEYNCGGPYCYHNPQSASNKKRQFILEALRHSPCLRLIRDEGDCCGGRQT